VAPGNACTEHPLISVTYLGIEAERIVPIFLLKTLGNIYKYKHLNMVLHFDSNGNFVF
jgi:hypothetical protein